MSDKMSPEASSYVYESLMDRINVVNEHLDCADKEDLDEMEAGWHEELALIEVALDEINFYAKNFTQNPK